MPVGFGVSKETARSVAKNFKKQRKYTPIKGGTFIRLPIGELSNKSHIQIPDIESLFYVHGNGQMWTKDDPNQKLLFKMDQNGKTVESKIVPFTPSKNPYKERLLFVAVGNFFRTRYL